MKILLDEFEHQIDEIILKRGFDYFKKGCVTDVAEDCSNYSGRTPVLSALSMRNSLYLPIWSAIWIER